MKKRNTKHGKFLVDSKICSTTWNNKCVHFNFSFKFFEKKNKKQIKKKLESFKNKNYFLLLLLSFEKWDEYYYVLKKFYICIEWEMLII
jgi:hypothetical protein